MEKLGKRISGSSQRNMLWYFCFFNLSYVFVCQMPSIALKHMVYTHRIIMFCLLKFSFLFQLEMVFLFKVKFQAFDDGRV